MSHFYTQTNGVSYVLYIVRCDMILTSCRVAGWVQVGEELSNSVRGDEDRCIDVAAWVDRLRVSGPP